MEDFYFLSIKVVIKYFLHKSIERLRHGGYEKICYDGHFCSIIDDLWLYSMIVGHPSVTENVYWIKTLLM